MHQPIHYQLAGSGRKVIFLLHGWGGSSKSLEELQKLLVGSFKVVNVDLPGFAASKEPDGVWGTKDYAKTIIQLADQLQIKKFSLFGHSFGGQIAAQAAILYPQRVEKLILCSSAAIRQSSKWVRLIKNISWAKKIGLSRLARQFFRHTDYYNSSPKMRLVMNKILQEDLTSHLSRIQSPTLILWGEEDRVTPKKFGEIIQQQIKGSILKKIPGARHNLPLFEPQLVADEMVNFLQLKS